jgi:hypothetical protein
MRAHIRTEAYLAELQQKGTLDTTIIREGLYNESWPLYFGYYHALKQDPRTEVLVAGDGPVSWTAIADMGFATARVLADQPGAQQWAGKTFYLSQKETKSLKDIASLVSEIKGQKVVLKVVGKKEYEDYYVENMGMERAAVEWWTSSYEALEQGECKVDDDTLERILSEAGRRPVALEETVREMMK